MSVKANPMPGRMRCEAFQMLQRASKGLAKGETVDSSGSIELENVGHHWLPQCSL